MANRRQNRQEGPGREGEGLRRDAYEILGVARNTPKDKIKSAYRRLARANHPDRHPGDRAKEDKFKEISEAWAILEDDDLRAAYDRGGYDEVDRVRKGGSTGPETQGETDQEAIDSFFRQNRVSRQDFADFLNRVFNQRDVADDILNNRRSIRDLAAILGEYLAWQANPATYTARSHWASGAPRGENPGSDTGTNQNPDENPDPVEPDEPRDPKDSYSYKAGQKAGSAWRGAKKWWQNRKKKNDSEQDPPDVDAEPNADETNFNEPPSPERQRENTAWATGRHGKSFVERLELLNDRLKDDASEKFNPLDAAHLERARAAKELYNTLYPQVKVAFDNQLLEITGLTTTQIAHEMGDEGKKFLEDFGFWVLRQSWEDVANPNKGSLETIIDADELLAKHKTRLERIKRYTEPGYVKSQQAKQELFERGYGKARWRWRDARDAQEEIDEKHPGEAESGWFNEVKNWRKIEEIKKGVEYAKTKAGPEAARAKEAIKKRRAEIFKELDNLNGLATEVENPAADKDDLNPLVGFRNMFNARIKNVLDVTRPTTYDLTPEEYKQRADQAELVLAQTKKVAEQLRQARLNGDDTEAFNVYKDDAALEDQELVALTEAAVERLKEEYLSKIARALFGPNANRIGELPPSTDIRKYVNRIVLHRTLNPRRASDALYAGAKALADKYAAETPDTDPTKLPTLDAVKTILDKLRA